MYLDVVNPNDMPKADTEKLVAAADAARSNGLDVELGGRTVQNIETGQSPTEMIGLIAAAVILLIMFGSVVAAGLPLILAIGGVAVSSGLAGLAAAITSSVAIMVMTAVPFMMGRPTANRPSMLTITVPAATRTERPAVSSVATVAASGSRPAARHSRNRVTMSRA